MGVRYYLKEMRAAVQSVGPPLYACTFEDEGFDVFQSVPYSGRYTDFRQSQLRGLSPTATWASPSDKGENTWVTFNHTCRSRIIIVVFLPWSRARMRSIPDADISFTYLGTYHNTFTPRETSLINARVYNKPSDRTRGRLTLLQPWNTRLQGSIDTTWAIPRHLLHFLGLPSSNMGRCISHGTSSSRQLPHVGSGSAGIGQASTPPSRSWSVRESLSN